MNPTNFYCPSDIAYLSITDYRPNKALYANVRNNNAFRLYVQENGNQIRNQLKQQWVSSMNCKCESRPRVHDSPMPFNPMILNQEEQNKVPPRPSSNLIEENNNTWWYYKNSNWLR